MTPYGVLRAAAFEANFLKNRSNGVYITYSLDTLLLLSLFQPPRPSSIPSPGTRYTRYASKGAEAEPSRIPPVRFTVPEGHPSRLLPVVPPSLFRSNSRRSTAEAAEDKWLTASPCGGLQPWLQIGSVRARGHTYALNCESHMRLHHLSNGICATRTLPAPVVSSPSGGAFSGLEVC